MVFFKLVAHTYVISGSSLLISLLKLFQLGLWPILPVNLLMLKSLVASILFIQWSVLSPPFYITVSSIWHSDHCLLFETFHFAPGTLLSHWLQPYISFAVFFFFFFSFPWTSFFLSMLTPLVIQSSIMDLNNHLFFDDYQMFVSILDLSSELYTNDAAACFISLLCLICMLELNMNLNILIFLLTPSSQFLSVFCILIAASSFQGLRTEIFESSLPSLFLLNFTSNLSQFWLYLRYLP